MTVEPTTDHDSVKGNDTDYTDFKNKAGDTVSSTRIETFSDQITEASSTTATGPDGETIELGTSRSRKVPSLRLGR